MSGFFELADYFHEALGGLDGFGRPVEAKVKELGGLLESLETPGRTKISLYAKRTLKVQTSLLSPFPDRQSREMR